jgi:hypothetical protein
MDIDFFKTINTVGNRNYTFALYLSLPRRQTITAIAAYRNAQQEVAYYVDTLSVQVTHPAPLHGPTYEARYNNQWIPIAPQEEMQVSIENEQVTVPFICMLKAASPYNTGTFR